MVCLLNLYQSKVHGVVGIARKVQLQLELFLNRWFDYYLALSECELLVYVGVSNLPACFLMDIFPFLLGLLSKVFLGEHLAMSEHLFYLAVDHEAMAGVFLLEEDVS